MFRNSGHIEQGGIVEFLIYFAIGIIYMSVSVARQPKKFKQLKESTSQGALIFSLGVVALLWPLIVLIGIGHRIAVLTPAGKRAQLKSREHEMSNRRKQVDSLLDEALALEAGSDEHQQKLEKIDELSEEIDDLATEIAKLRR